MIILMKSKYVTLPEWLTGSPAISIAASGWALPASVRIAQVTNFFQVQMALCLVTGSRGDYLRGPDTAIDTKATRLPRENLTSTTRPSANSATNIIHTSFFIAPYPPLCLFLNFFSFFHVRNFTTSIPYVFKRFKAAPTNCK